LPTKNIGKYAENRGLNRISVKGLRHEAEGLCNSTVTEHISFGWAFIIPTSLTRHEIQRNNRIKKIPPIDS